MCVCMCVSCLHAHTHCCVRVTSTTYKGRVPVDLVEHGYTVGGKVLSTADVGEVCSVVDYMAAGIGL